MAQAYHFTFIDAPIETVWRVVFHDAEQHGSITSMQEPNLIVVQSQDIFSVYGLRQYPAMENKTGVYLVLTHDEAAVGNLLNTPDMFRALEAIPVDVAPDMYEGAKTHLQNIKTLANEADKRALAYAAKPGSNTQKSSIDPRKSGMEPQPPFGEGMPVIRLRLVWVVFTLFIVAMYFLLLWANGIFAGAALLALNWWSLGNPRKAVSTLVSSIGVWGILSFLVQLMLLRLNMGRGSTLYLSLVIQLIIAAGVLFWQIKQQRPVYQHAVERYGKPSGWALRNVGLTIAVIIIGGIVGKAWTEGFTMVAPQVSMTMASQQTYADDRITFNYPAHWDAAENFDEFCDGENAECLLQLREPADASAFVVVRNTNLFGFLVTLDGVVRYDTSGIEADSEAGGNVGETTQLRFKINGREAIKYQYYYRLEQGTAKIDMIGTFLFIQDDRDLIRMYIYTPVELVGTAEAIIDSVQFMNPLPD